MASAIYLWSFQTAYYISGAGTAYTGSGTPWTAQATTPFEIAMNDTDGRWTPTTPTQQAIYTGGPPFRFGQTLMYTAEGNVVEQIMIYARANTPDNASVLLRLLRKILNTGLSQPCILRVLPDGMTNPTFFEIYHADVQEDAAFMNDEAGMGFVRIRVTWTREPHGGGSSSTTLINAQTIENDGTGTPDNIISLGSPAGELLWSEGGLLNLQLKDASTDLYNVWMATVVSTSYNSISQARTTTTSTDFVTSPWTTVTIPTTARNHRNLKMRIVGRFTTFTNLSKAQIQVVVWDISTSSTVLYASPKISPLNSTASFIDFGAVSLEFFQRQVSYTPSCKVQIILWSTDGTSVTATLDYFEALFYFDFCRIGPVTGGVNAVNYLYVEQFNSIAGGGIHRTARPSAYCRRVTGDNILQDCIVRGRLPRAREYDGGSVVSLWFAWTNSSDQHDKADQLALTVEQGSIFYSFRGSV